MDDAEEYRAASRERWEEGAAGWSRQQAVFERALAPVTHALVEGVRPQPGQQLLEVACGMGETGLLAAELVVPGGTVVLTDGAQAMVDAARANAERRGATNVEARTMEAEWLDVPTATLDGILCRFGYMLLADPGAALREARRALRPGGRLALAVWDAGERNPWASLPWSVLRAEGLVEPADPRRPDMFAFAADDRTSRELEEAGFADHELVAIDIVFAFDEAADWFDALLDLSGPLDDLLKGLEPERSQALLDTIAGAASEHLAPDGTLALPGRVLVAVAEA